MGVLRQFGQLLWKNFILRKREPHVLVLELLWPLLIFIIVALIRYGAPPKERSTCSYQERAMPSSGMFPFLQSTACNLQNTCEEPSSIEKKQQSASRISALISDLEPLLSDPKTVAAIKTVNVSVKVVKGLQELTANNTLDKIIGDFDDFTVKKFFRDPDKVYEILVSDLKVMTPSVADALLNSTVNVVSLLNLFGGINFKTIVCSEDLLKQYMVFRKDVNTAQVSKELCAIDNDNISAITDVVQTQLDVAALIRMAKSLTTLTNRYELADAMEDMATMTDLFYQSSTIGGMMKMMNIDLPSVMAKLPTWVDTMTKMQTLDTSSIDAVMGLLKPMAGKMFNDSQWNSAEQAIADLKEMIEAVGSGENTNWTAVLEKGMKLVELFGDDSINLEWLKKFAGMPVEELTNITTALFSGNTQMLQNMSAEQTMKFVQMTFELFLGKNSTMTMLAVTNGAMDTGVFVLSYLNDMDRAAERMLKENGHLLMALDRVYKMGPNVTAVMWDLLFKTNFFMDLFKNPLDESKCRTLIQQGMPVLGYAVVIDLQKILCNTNVTMAVNQMVDLFNITDFQKKIEMSIGAIDKILKGHLPQPPVSMLTVYQKYLTVSQLFDYLIKHSLNARWIESTKHHSNQTAVDWNPLMTSLGSSVFQGSWPSMMVMIGSALENSTMWKTVHPYIRSMDVMMDYMINQMEVMQDMANESSTMGKLMKYASEYSSEIMTALMSMDGTMMQKIMTTPDPIVLICDQKILSQMGMPSYVPVADMESLICSTNWTQFVMDISSAYNTEPMMQQIQLIFSDSSPTTAPFDWEGMVSDSQKLMNLMQNQENLSSMMAKMNFTKILQAFASAMAKMENMQSQDPVGMLVGTMSQMEMSMKNVTGWKAMKYYVKLYEAYIKFYTKILLRTNGTTVDLNRMLSNLSKTFEEFVSKSASTMPDFLEALKTSAADPFVLIMKMMTKINMTNLCQENVLADIFGVSSTSAIAKYEQHLCKLNWTAVIIEMMQNDADLRKYIELQIFILSTPMNDWPDIALNWTEVVMTAQHYMEVMSSYKIPKITFSSLDVMKLNMTWESLMQGLTSLQNMDKLGQQYDSFYSFMKMFSNSGNQSNVMKQMEIMGAMIQYQSYNVLHFMTIHLSYINSTGYLNLKTYLNSNEFNKILDNIAASPDISATGLQTMADMMSDMSKANQIIRSWDKMCSDLTVFTSIITAPKDRVVDMGALQQGLCGLNLNFTKLIMELSSSLKGFPEVLQAFTMDTSRFNMDTMYVNQSTVQKETEKVQLLIQHLMMKPPTVSLGVSESWMNFTIYEQQWNAFIQKMSKSLSLANMAQIQGQGLITALSGLTAIPEFNTILQYISLSVTQTIKQYNRTLAGFQDPLAIYDGYPNLQKLMKLADDIPHLYVAWAFNSIYNPSKIVNVVMQTSWEAFCGLNAAALPDNLPGATFNVATFHSQLCAINMTALMTEASHYQGTEQFLKLMSTNVTQQVDLAKLSAQITEFTNMMMSNFTDLNNMVLPDYLNMTVWEMAYAQLTAAISDPQRLMQLSSRLTQFTGYMMNQNITMQQDLKFFATMYGIIGVALDKLDMLSNDTILNIDELLAHDPETRKLWIILQKPGFLETLLYSANTPKFSQLFMKTNITEVLMLLCHPVTGDLGTYLTVPSYVSLNLTELKIEFCNVNIAKLPQEFMEEISQVLSLISDDTKNLNWTAITAQNLRLQEWISKWSATPPTIKLPMAWQNMSFWIDMLTKYSQANMIDPSNTESIWRLMRMFSGLQAAINHTTEWKFVNDFLSTGKVMIDTVNKLLMQLISQGTKLDLATLFQDSATLKNLMTSTGKISDDVITGLFTGYLKHGKISDFLTVIATGKLPELFCDENKIKDIFSFPASFNVTSLVKALCGLNDTVIMNEVVNQLKLQPLITKMMTSMMTNTSSEAVDIKSLMTAVQQLSENMMQVMNISSVTFSWLNMDSYANFNMTTFNMLLMEELQNYQDTQAAILSEMLQPLLQNSTDMKRMAIAFSVFSSWSKSLFSTLSANLNKPVTFAALFGNSTLGTTLSKLFNNPRWMEELLQVQIDTQQLMSVLNSNNVTQVMCSQRFYEIFTVPGNATVLPELQKSLCKSNQTALLYDMMSILLIDHNMYQQLQALFDENALGSIAFNFSKMYKDSAAFSAALTDLIEKIFQSDMTNSFNATDLISFFTKLGTLLSQQYTQQLSSWIPMLSDSLGQVLDSSYNRMVHTINVFVKYINSRLIHLTGTVSLNTLFGNATDIVKVLEAYVNVQIHHTLVFSKEFNLEKFMMLSANPTLVQELCKNKTLASHLSLGSQTLDIAKDYETLMCLDEMAFLNTVGDKMGVNYLSMQLNKIWNSTDVAPINWMEFNSNMNNLTNLITGMIQKLPILDRSLMTLFDFNFTMNSLVAVFIKEPESILRVLYAYPVDAFNIDTSSIGDLLEYWNKMYPTVIKVLKEAQGAGNSNVLNDFWKSLEALNTQLFGMGASYYKAVFERLANYTEIQSFVCNMTAMIQYMSVEVAKNVSTAVCGHPGNSWYDRLMQKNVVVKILLDDLTAATGKSSSPKVSWKEFVKQLQDLTQILQSLNSNQTDKLLQMVMESLNTANEVGVASAMQWLKQFGNNTMFSVQGYLNFLVEINKYLSYQLSMASKHGGVIPVTLFLPNNTEVVKMLELSLGPKTAATLLTANMNPEKFFELSMSNKYVTVVCNITYFKEAFIFPAGTDLESVQKDLCADAQKQNSAVTAIIQSLNAANVMKAFEDWMNGNIKGSLSDKDLYAAISNHTTLFVQNLERLQKFPIDMGGFEKWVQPIYQAMQTFNTQSQITMGQTCDRFFSYISENEEYKMYWEPYLQNMYHTMKASKHQMQLQMVIEKSVCDMDNMNLTTLLEKLKEGNLTQLLTTYLQQDNSTMTPFVCSDYTALTTEMSAMFNATIYRYMTDNTTFLRCLNNGLKIPLTLITDTAQTFKLAGQLLEIMSDPTIQSLARNSDILDIIQLALKAYIQQSKVALKLSDLMKNITDVTQFLSGVLKLTPEMINVLLNSTLKFDGMSLFNQSSASIQAVICDPDKLSKVITLPAFSKITVANISSMLCPLDIAASTDALKSMIDISSLTMMISQAGSGNMSWWNLMSAHLIKVFVNIEQLYKFSEFKIDMNNLNALLPLIQRLVYDSGPDVLAQSIIVLMEDFKRLDNDTAMQQLLTDFQKIVAGMTSLKVIRNFIPLNVVLGDVVKDKDAMRKYMMNDLGFSMEVTDALLTGSVAYAKLMNYQPKNLQATLCNVNQLEEVLNVTSNKANLTAISSALCSLSEAQIVNLTDSLLENLNVGTLIEKYVKLGLDAFVKNFNISSAEARDSLKKLNAAQDDLKAAANLFSNKSKEFNLNVFNSPEALKGADSLSSLSSLICGSSSDSFAMSDSSGVSSKMSSTEKLDEDQIKEMQELPGAFCQELYADIVSTKEGSVIWTYLKPLLRGKILFSPDTAATRRLMEMMNNKSFAILSDVRTYAKDWAAGLYEISDLKSDDKVLAEVKKLVSSAAVSGFLQSVLGVTSEDVTNSFDTLDSFDKKELNQMKNLADIIYKYTGCLESDRFTGMATEDDLLKEALKLGQSGQYLAGIVFTNLGSTSRKKRATNTNLPKHISYKIRMDIENVRHTNRIKSRMWVPDPDDDMVFEMRYLRGFSQLQDMVEQAIIQMQTGKADGLPTVNLQQFPTFCHKHDVYLTYLAMYLLPVLMTFAWLASMAVSAKNLVYDREHAQEETLKIMGMRSYLNWWAWFLVTMAVMAISALISVGALRIGKMFLYTDFGIMFLYFLTFCFSSTMMCYMVSSFFTRTTLAVLTVMVVYLLSYLPYIILISLDAQMLTWHKILACLSSTTAFGFGAQYLARYEVTMTGINWHNIDKSPMDDDDLSFSWMCYMMLIDSAAYLLIGWYVRNVKPGKYGVSQPWYFPICPWYWGCVGKSSSSRNKYLPSSDAAFVESVPSNFVVGLSLRGLSKTYGKQKVVQNLSADLYEGQITALLGHNGAAKTTTINMLVGVLEPTEGAVSMYGRSLSNSAHMIGFCSQHDALFHYMTVLEHMKFYGSIKSNLSKKEQDYEIQQLLKEVDLWHVQDSRVNELSGGMRRRLSVALAFVGGSSVIILDEPTSGVDPQGRRCIWNLIQKRKNRCTVLLSTHHLDEADMIGDRVAVMHKGRLMCSGSPLYLKQKLGSGYHLKLDKQDSKCDVGRVMSTVQSWIPGAQLTEDIGSEMTILLPVQYDTMDRLYKCLHDLDLNSTTLGVSNYGIFDTTMEEVFMKVCDICDNNLPLTIETAKAHSGKAMEGKMIIYRGEQSKNRPQESTLEMTGARQDPRERVSSGTHKLQQYSALTVKRFHHYRRNWRLCLSIFFLPLIFVAAALGFMTIRPDDTEARSLMLTPAMYGPNSYTFFKNTVGDDMSQELVNHIMASPGMSTTCMAGMKPGSPYVCKKSDSAFYTPNNQKTSQGNCTCEDYKYVCVTPPKAAAVPQVVTETTEILLDLNGYDVQKYLLNTYDKFKLIRYGGWTFNKEGKSTKALVWFNNRGHHAMPAFYNAYSNALLRSLVPDSEAADYGITVYNHPVMMHKEQLTQDTILQSAADLGIAAVLLTALTFLPVGFMIYVVSEYKNKERQLEFVSGVGVFLYWFTSLIWDLFMYCITTGLIIAIMAIFQQSPYWARDNLAGSVVLILMYGWAMIPSMYCTVKFFRDSTSAYMVLFCSSVFIGIMTIAIIFILDFFSSSQGVKEAYDVVKYVFLIFPQYSLAEGFIQLTANQIQSEILARFGEDVYVSPFSFDLLLWNYIAMAIVGFVSIILMFILEIRCSSRKSLPADSEEDLSRGSQEVNNEKQRVLTGYARDDILIVSKLSKVYTRNKKDFLAVNRASFGVPNGECFGLLGVNGAGKTTTFRMLTGDILSSDGTAYINHRKVGKASVNMGRNVGYCPQENALDLYLTGRELLYCHAKLRGIPPKCRKTAVETLIQKLKIEYADRTIHTYSGGMKRKLSTAVALLGEPSVVFLDEPTTGMDPAAKRLVWDCILEAVRNNQSVILTSHSMEECDVLCTRLAIMVNGEFCCLGSPQFLKHKYGDGYTVVLHISGLSTIKYAISEFINTHFPQAIIREQHFSALQLDIPKASTTVTNIIKCLEEEKEALGITHYSVSQTTLDNVFLNFARDQTDGTDGTDLSSGGSGGSDIDSLTHLSEPFTNPTYAYMNPNCNTKDEDLSSKPSAFLMASPQQIIPDFSTKL